MATEVDQMKALFAEYAERNGDAFAQGMGFLVGGVGTVEQIARAVDQGSLDRAKARDQVSQAVQLLEFARAKLVGIGRLENYVERQLELAVSLKQLLGSAAAEPSGTPKARR